MKIKQISVFLENRSGRLAGVSQVLASNNINIRALSMSDTSDFGILRLIVDNFQKALDILQSNGFTAKATDVLAVEVEDQPGGLEKVLTVLDKAKMNIEYMYSFVEKNQDKAIMIFRFDNIDEAIKTLSNAGIKTFKGEDIFLK